MNAWRWFGLTIFLFATLCVVGTKYSEAVVLGDKKVDISATPAKGEVKAGEKQDVKLKVKRKDGDKDVDLTVEVAPKDKGVTVKVDPKVLGGDSNHKMTIETAAGAEGDYKITVHGKSAGSDDGSMVFALTVKKGDAKAKEKEKEKEQPKGGGEKLPFKAFDAGGKPFYQEQTTETIQNMTVQGQKVKQEQKQTFLILWTPAKEKDKDGNFVVTQQIKGVKMAIDIGGNKIEYDSTKKNPKNPMTDFFDKLMDDKMVLTFHISEGLEVKKIDGREDFIKNLSDINPQMKNLLNAILSDKALQKMAEPAWWAYPPKGEVPSDKKWTNTAKLELGPIGTYETKFDFEFKGKDNQGNEDVGIKTELKYAPPGANEKAGLPFVIESATLTGKNGEGKAIYDRANGRFKSTTLKMEIKGDLEISVGNQKTRVELTQTQDAKSETSDASPWPMDKKGNP